MNDFQLLSRADNIRESDSFEVCSVRGGQYRVDGSRGRFLEEAAPIHRLAPLFGEQTTNGPFSEPATLTLKTTVP